MLRWVQSRWKYGAERSDSSTRNGEDNMTFLEAAIEVLRNTEEPLHFSAIAKAAVDRKLLSHVGRDPEAAMRSCLNSAVRGGSSALVERSKPGYYRIRPGAPLPEPAVVPAEPEASAKAEPEAAEAEPAPRKSAAKKSGRTRKKTTKATREGTEGKPTKRKSTRKSAAKKTEASGESGAAEDAEKAEDAPSEGAAAAEGATGEAGADVKVEFEAPTGSGLEGVTDVAIVMANAMSRLAEERPELREELEAMQQRQQEGEESSGPIIQTKPTRARREEPEERGGRRRRRRRRRARRVEWTGPSGGRASAAGRADELLDQVAAVLAESGPRSLHIRQVAETLASQNVLGGEISEIERAVTSAILMDVQARGRASRFAVRGDARYQLQGSRVPEGAAKAEKVFRDAALALENETRLQLVGWLGSLGARALESLVRMYLQREGYNLVATLPPGRGLGKLIAEDPDGDDEDAKALVLVVPRRTSLEPKLWDGEAERNQCSSTLVFSMADSGAERVGDARVLYAPELAEWLSRHQIGINRVSVEVPVLDASVIESIGGLDT